MSRLPQYTARVRHRSQVGLLFVLGCLGLATHGGGSSWAETTGSFEFDYIVNKGLDCASLDDCGVRFQLSEDGELVYSHAGAEGVYEPVETYSVPTQDRKRLSALLIDSGFFSFPPVLPETDRRIGSGTVTVIHRLSSEAIENAETKVTFVLGGDLSSSAQDFLRAIADFFRHYHPGDPAVSPRK